MQVAKQQVVDLIHDYQAAVYRAVALLNAKSEQEKGFQMPLPVHLGSLKRVQYSFHGTGCMVTTPELKVDFDYTQEGGCTGIDTWLMVYFLKSNSAIQAKYPLLTSDEQVEQVLQELVKDDLLIKHLYSVHDRRYYLKADIPNPNLPTVTLHMPDEEVAR